AFRLCQGRLDRERDKHAVENRARRSLVGPAAAGGAGAGRLQHLRVPGGGAERQLLCRALPVALLLTVSRAKLRPSDDPDPRPVVEPEPGVSGAGLAPRLPRHLLLLSPRLLPRLLLVAAGVRGA